jgi:Dyp-type peroxidase family
MFDGSFLVVRRLNQDVPGWWEQAETLKDSFSAPADAAGAKLVGRWRSGVPVDLSPNTDPRGGADLSNDNNFDYADDPTGAKTPLCSHIRKVNPRAGVPGQDEVSKHRILRRGIPYGAHFEPAPGKNYGADAPRGLVFACYQASIADQFDFLQDQWADNSEFPAQAAGPDPVIGPAGQATIPGTTTTPTPLARFVSLQGALYAFTPSIPTLTALASGTQLPVT